MASLAPPSELRQPAAQAAGRWTGSQTRAQFAAVAHLRWLIFRNNIRRKNNVGDLIALCIMVPLFLALALGPATGAGMLAYWAVSSGNLIFLGGTLWGIFLLCQLTSIQLGQPGTTFDPTQLIRFPLAFPGYALIRLFFGLLSPSNLMAVLASFAVAVGISVAQPGLALVAFAVMGAYALTNIFFTRMVFTWVDRWLSTRRAREVFTGFVVAFSLGIQYANFAFNPAYHHKPIDKAAAMRHLATAKNVYHHAEPVLAVLPPGLASHAVSAAQRGAAGLAVVQIAGILLFAALFFVVFAFRLYKEFRGENLSNAATPGKEHAPVTQAAVLPGAAAAAVAIPSSAAPMRFAPPNTVSAVLLKEFTTMRRTSGIFYAVLAPLVMVIFFVSKISLRSGSGMVFAAAVAYTMLGIAPLAYNSLGMEAAGIQFYFLAPVRMRDIFIAKNLMNFALAALELVAVLITISLSSRAPSLQMIVSVMLWAVFTLLISTAVGNRRSITAPKKLDAAKMQNKQAPPLSALLSMGILITSAALGAGLMFTAQWIERPWLLPLATALLAAIGALVYVRSLNSLDDVVAKHRDTLSETLCKAG